MVLILLNLSFSSRTAPGRRSDSSESIPRNMKGKSFRDHVPTLLMAKAVYLSQVLHKGRDIFKIEWKESSESLDNVPSCQTTTISPCLRSHPQDGVLANNVHICCKNAHPKCTQKHLGDLVYSFEINGSRH